MKMLYFKNISHLYKFFITYEKSISFSSFYKNKIYNMNKYCTLKEQKKYNHLIESDKLYDIIKNKEECLLF